MSTRTPRGVVWRKGKGAYIFGIVGRFALATLVLVSATFAMIHLIPGDPVRAALGRTASPELVAERREALGLNHSLARQYVDYLWNVAHGNLGTSFVTGQPVSEILSTRLPNTFALAVPAFVVVMVVSVPIGLLMAILTRDGRRRGAELAFTAVTGIFNAVPEFLMAVMLVVIFAVTLRWLPVAGISGPTSYVLPIVALAAAPTATLSRIVRVEVLRVLAEDYMRTAQSKRLPPAHLYVRHALPNVFTSVFTLGGLVFGGLIAGTVLVENVFAWPGIGSTVVQSVLQKDYAVVQGIALVLGACVLTANLLVDFAIATLDPRSALHHD